MVELCIVTEESARAALRAILLTAVLAANAIMNTGTEAQKAKLLPNASGARLRPGDHRAERLAGSIEIETVARFRLDGAKSYVGRWPHSTC